MEVQVFLKCGHVLFIETDQFYSIGGFFLEYNNSKRAGNGEIRIGTYQIKHSDIAAVGCDYIKGE